MDDHEALIPTEVVVARDRRSVRLSWTDHHATLEGAVLRAACRCGPCSAARRRGVLAIPGPGGAAIADIRPFGALALNLIFADGHDRGVFPWAYLREIAERSTQANS